MFNCCCLSKNTPKEVEDGVEKIQTSSSESDTISIVKIRDSKKNTIKRASTESEEEHNDMSCDDANNASALVFNDGLVVDDSNITVFNGIMTGEYAGMMIEPRKTTASNDHCLNSNSSAISTSLVHLNSNSASRNKRVTCREPAEIISISEDFDDDDVFSDFAPSQTPRGNMCAPFVARKGSLPVTDSECDWFPENSIDAPPTTPVGRDEIELRRHQFFIDFLDAPKITIKDQVRYDFMVKNNSIKLDDAMLTTTQHTSVRDPSSRHPKKLINLIERLEIVVARLEKYLPSHPESLNNYPNDFEDEQYLPTVLPQIDKHLEGNQQSNHRNIEQYREKIMSVNAYEDIILGPLAQFLDSSNKIGGDVATQADFVKKAFDAQLKYVTLASLSSTPDQNELPKLLQPTSEQINAIQAFREKNRTSVLFNHLSAISESIAALGWVCVAPTPGPHVKEMNDAGQFYTNRVLKEWKEKDITHVNWAKAWIQTLNDLQAYIKQYHTTGIVWAGKSKTMSTGSVPPPPPPVGGLPPPPPAMQFFDQSSTASGDDRNALFAQINQGEYITKSLKKVTSDMQTHKNPTLRTGPAASYKGPIPFKPTIATKPGAKITPIEKPPVFNRDGKKWIIEYQKNNKDMVIDGAEMNNVVYMFKSDNSTLTVKGKINSIIIDSCKKCSVVFDSLVSSVEFVNCQSVQMQVLGKVPTISIDKTDGCQMYLSNSSLDVEIVSSKSSEMNVMLPTPSGDDYAEQPIPEQFKSTISGNSLRTICIESLG